MIMNSKCTKMAAIITYKCFHLLYVIQSVSVPTFFETHGAQCKYIGKYAPRVLVTEHCVAFSHVPISVHTICLHQKQLTTSTDLIKIALSCADDKCEAETIQTVSYLLIDTDISVLCVK